MGTELREAGGQEDFQRFLARRVALYAGTGHSSVPKDLALELFASIRFTLEQAGDVPADSLDGQFAAGVEETRRKVAYGKRLLAAACRSLPQVENRSLTDTLRSMRGFFRRYDVRFFAHQIPCDIDYQLSQSVPEGVEGINYVNQYLTRLCMEHDFLGRFDPQFVRPLLTAYCGDYRGLLINLYEPVAVNALGLALVGGDVAGLNITPQERARLAALLGTAPADVLRSGAARLCRLLNITQPPARRYLRSLAAGLVPRVEHADLAGIFLSF